MTLADVQGKLMLSEEQRIGAMDIFQRLKQALLGCHHGIRQVDLSGSLARGTAMAQDFDLDIRLLVSDSHWAYLDPLKKQVQSTLARKKIQFKSDSEHILKISLKNSKGEEFFADLVFTSQRAVGNKQELESHENPDEPNIKSKSLAFRAFYALQNDQKLIKQYDMTGNTQATTSESLLFWPNFGRYGQ